MKTLKLIFCMVLFPWLLQAQTPVDRLVHTLDSLALVSFDQWKYSTDFRVDPTAPDFDDSQWPVLNIGQNIYPDSCWLRKVITLPKRMLGQPISGPMRFLVSVDDYGYLWVNGQSMGYFPWDGEFELTPNAQPGQRFVIVIKSINNVGPLRLLRARIESAAARPIRQRVQDFALGLRVAQKLLSFDTYQTTARLREDPGIDRSRLDRQRKIRLNRLLQKVASQVNARALIEGSLQEFKHSLARVEAQLQSVADFAKQFTLIFDANAHIDAAWLWREKETVEVCKNTFTAVLDMMEARPDFTYTQSSAAYYDWMERFYPRVFERIRQRVMDGRWEVVGGMWVEPDCNLPNGVSWTRHLLYAKRYFRQKLRAEVTLGWNPDSFGYNWNIPQFFHAAGIDAFITQKIGWNDTNIFPYRLFWWQAPDGTRILAYFPFSYVNDVSHPFRLVDWLRQFEANTGFRKMLILFGVGDHGGGPTPEMLDRVEHLKTLAIFPRVQYGTAGHYINWLRQQDLGALPVWNDELYLEYHRGTYTTQAKMKANNRRSEVLLANAEKFSTLATRFGAPYPGVDLEQAWRHVLFNQFHDILPGSGIREIYLDALERYRKAQTIGRFNLNHALRQIAGRINTTALKRGRPVVVFNPLAWQRSDIVKLELPEGDTTAYALFDREGREVPCQTIKTGRYRRMLLFRAEKVPSLGYATYELRPARPSVGSDGLAVSQTRLENRFLRVEIDPHTGWVKQIVDKRNGREVLRGPGNELQLLEDKPDAWDAWNIGLTGKRYASKLQSIEVAERGPVRVVVRLRRGFLNPKVKKSFPAKGFPNSFFTQDIILYRDADRVDFETRVDWWEDKTMLKVAFPVVVEDSVATYEIPFGTIQRSTRSRTSWEKARFEVPALRWADLSREGYGVSLLNTAKYGYDIKGHVMRLSLLRSPKWPDPTADRGKHRIVYALYPHAGDWRQAQTIRHARELNAPLIAIMARKHGGSLPLARAFVKLSPANLILTSLKRAEDSQAWVIQWYESEGREAEAVLQLPEKPRRAVMSTFMEQDGDPLPIRGKTVRVPTGTHKVITMKVWF